MNDDWPVLELRQYTLRPGQRDVMIELFDRELVHTQELTGMRIVGQFRDLDDPDRFVWIRAFTDLHSRGQALSDFYEHGTAWKTHGPAANATMIDSSNALLLRPTRPGSGFTEQLDPRPAGSVVTATTYRLDRPVDQRFVEVFTQEFAPALTVAGAPPLASLSTEYAENTFPRLPVRTGEHLFVWFATFDSAEHHRALQPRLTEPPALRRLMAAAPQLLRLAPTAGSRLR